MAGTWGPAEKSKAVEYSIEYFREWGRLWDGSSKDPKNFDKRLRAIFPQHIVVQVFNSVNDFNGKSVYEVAAMHLYCNKRANLISKLIVSPSVLATPGGVDLLKEIQEYYIKVSDAINGLIPLFRGMTHKKIYSLAVLIALGRHYRYLIAPAYDLKLAQDTALFKALADLMQAFRMSITPLKFIYYVSNIEDFLDTLVANFTDLPPDAADAVKVMNEAFIYARDTYASKIAATAKKAEKKGDLTEITKKLSKYKEKKLAPPTAVSSDWEKILSEQIGVPVKILPADPGSTTSATTYNKFTGTYIIKLFPKNEVDAVSHLIHEQGHIRVTFQKEMQHLLDIYGGKMLNIADDLRINMYYSERNVGFREGMKKFFMAVKPPDDSDPLALKSWHLFYIATQFGADANPQEAVILDMARTLGIKLPKDFPISYDSYVKAISLYFYGKENEESLLRKKLYDIIRGLYNDIGFVNFSAIRDLDLRDTMRHEMLGLSALLNSLALSTIDIVMERLPDVIKSVRDFVDKYRKGVA